VGVGVGGFSNNSKDDSILRYFNSKNVKEEATCKTYA
jgi:hypothetical protein